MPNLHNLSKPPVVVAPPHSPELTHSRSQGIQWQQGVFWAILSPLFLGTIPILAKFAYAAGVNVLTVVAFRTLFAALLLWLAMIFFGRQYIKSSTPAVVSSVIAGAINGIGSLFFYASLTRIDASLGQLINISYLIFVTLLLRLVGQNISWLTAVRTLLAISAIYLLTVGGIHEPNWVGVGMMFIAALTFAIQLVLSQRILYDIPAQTMTLYAISAMAGVVTIAWIIFPTNLHQVSSRGWEAVLLMGLATALSRLTLFLGVKHLGSIQAALLGMLEVIVSLTLAAVLLGERFTMIQWVGTAVLLTSVFLARFERGVPKFVDWWQFIWRWRVRK